jgi:thiosulfate/3-mercaptopyruvate sulfurtransferase
MLHFMTSRARWTTIRAAVLLAAVLAFSQEVANPWPESALLEPGDLAKTLSSAGKKPAVICVAFPVLYRTRHITGAVVAGPGNRPEGIDALKKAVVGMAKDSDLVLYCGCCPMTRCPNIRPAYQALKEMGFTRVRVLSIPTNMAADWYQKGYPSEAGSTAGPGQ